MSDPIQHLRELMAKAPKMPPESQDSEHEGYITCPHCDGVSDVELLTSDVTSRGDTIANINTLGVQFFGIGEDHIIMNQLVRHALNTLPALLAVAEAARKYRDASRAVCEHHEGFDGIDLKGLVIARELDEAKEAAYAGMANALAELDEVKP